MNESNRRNTQLKEKIEKIQAHIVKEEKNNRETKANSKLLKKSIDLIKKETMAQTKILFDDYKKNGCKKQTPKPTSNSIVL